MGIEDCVYDHVKKRGIGKTLRMGEACKRCRSARTYVGVSRKDVLTFESPVVAIRTKKKVSG